MSLGIELKILDISKAVDVFGVYDLLPLKFVPGNNLKNLLVKLGRWSRK